MSDVDNEIVQLRNKLTTLEQRESELSKRLDKIVGKLDTYDPELNALMREGLPLELFTRASLLSGKYVVHGYFAYYLHNTDKGNTERSIDIYASRETIYHVPEDGGCLANQAWPERNNLLVECKQRREGVRWVFCWLPTSEKEWSIAGKDVPCVNSGFELRPSNEGYQSSANTKDVKNAISQLNEAYIPFLVTLESKTKERLQFSQSTTRKREYTWLLLVTNATLKVFNAPKTFENLLTDSTPDDSYFTAVPWLVFKPDRPLALLYHQQAAIASLPEPKDKELSTARLLAEQTHEVHIVNYRHLSAFLALVDDPPRIKSINVSLKVDIGPESTYSIT